MLRLALPVVFVFSFSIVLADLPNPRHLEEITYDKERDRLILFGGAEIMKEPWKEPGGLFEWEGKNWKKIEIQGPVGRRRHDWVYDENERETFLIGGVTTGKIVVDSVLFDVWSWNGVEWKLLNSECPVKEPEAVYDGIQKRVLVYGEATNKSIISYEGERKFELLQFKSRKWTKLSAEGPDFTGSRMISFDLYRSRLVIPVFDQKQLIVGSGQAVNGIKQFVRIIVRHTVQDLHCPITRLKNKSSFSVAFQKSGNN